MSLSTEPKVEALCLSEEEEKEVVMRCFRMVDYLSEAVSNYILGFVQNVPCETAKQFLLSRPEEFTLKTFEKTIHDITHARGRPKGPLN